MDSQPRPDRRWLRFSLRTLLMLTALLAVCLGVQVDRAHKQRAAVAAAVAAVKSAGGKVELLYPLDRDYGSGWLDRLGFESRQQPLNIYLAAAQIDDALLRYLNNLPSGSSLHLISAQSAKYTRQLPSLNVEYYCSKPSRDD